MGARRGKVLETQGQLPLEPLHIRLLFCLLLKEAPGFTGIFIPEANRLGQNPDILLSHRDRICRIAFGVPAVKDEDLARISDPVACGCKSNPALEIFTTPERLV